ncbi:MAG TPA: methyltransferase domain-containing protein [Pseudomonas xinjiangensis]|uniref:Methyltransferase domain-containing protein n=2 Tax=root TaxID=1 RepID=A0A7V1BQI7_9GAMM|nr:methyltransferase domain-containing protein [Halopseudomonas xinjiangensis]HEC46712.1 methyltransferase domain-containing protein [Halopseudomonas xinjiangensis]
MAIPGISRSISQDDLIRLLKVARVWLDSPPGQMLMDSERELMRTQLQRCFGQHLVQYGLSPDLLDVGRSVLRNHWQLDLLADRSAIPVEETQWPFAPQSLDVVVLHHGLDFCLSPRSVLREASQSVRAGGHLLIFGFNPWSSWGMNHIAGRGWFSEAGFVRPSRLVDWLELLGFAVEKRIDGCYRPPLASQRWLDRLEGLEDFGRRHQLSNGGFYFLMARRQVLGVTPKRERGRVFPALTLPPLVAGSRRAHKRNDK